jgi:xylulokinase
MTLLAGVDSSTQSCTVELRDASTGERRGVGRAPHPRTYPPISEQHPDRWWEAFKVALRAAGADAGVAVSRIAALSVGAQCHGLVLLGADDRVLRPAKLWNDTTSGPDVERLISERPQTSWLREVLVTMNPALTISKLAWVARNEPEHLAAAAKVMLPHEWLTYRLTGHQASDRSDASGTGYFHAPSGRYRADLLAQHVSDTVPWDDLLGEVLGPDDVAGPITPAISQETGLSTQCRVAAGGGDQELAAIGIGLMRGEGAFSLGTSGVVFTPTREPVYDSEARFDNVCDVTGGYLPEICLLNCTKVTDLFAHFLGVTHAQFAQMALSARGSGTVLLPYLDGERVPMRPDATGLLAGLKTSTTREDVAYAAFQGVVGSLVDAMRVLEAHAYGGAFGRRIVTGGGSRSKAFPQFIADALGDPVVLVNVPEATARGAAIQAMAAISSATVAEVTEGMRPAEIAVFEPRPGHQASWLMYERLITPYRA